MCTQEEFNDWEELMMVKHVNFVRTIYWKLDDEHCTVICRNKPWFHWFLPKLTSIFEIIEKEKNGDWSVRLPKRKVKQDAPSLIVKHAPAELFFEK